jgi:hypothetical protein
MRALMLCDSSSAMAVVANCGVGDPR